MYAYIVLLHVVGAFLFALAHGVSIAVALRLRGRRPREEVSALLTLSQMSIGAVYVGLLLLLVGGVWAGFAGDHWGRAWIWAAIAILVVVMAAMYAMATPFYGRIRAATGAEAQPAAADGAAPVGAAELDALASSSRPLLLAGIGGVGLLAILWLMVVKPF